MFTLNLDNQTLIKTGTVDLYKSINTREIKAIRWNQHKEVI